MPGRSPSAIDLTRSTAFGSERHAAATGESSHTDRQRVLQGMACVDTSGNTSIPILMEMVAGLSRANDAKSVLREFTVGLRRLRGPRGYVSISTRGLGPGEYKITRLLHPEDIDKLGEEDPWANWDALPIHTGGFLGEILRQAYPELIHHLNIENDPVLGDKLARYQSLMAIPLFDNGEPLNWSISLSEEPDAFTEQELEEAILRTNLGGSAVRNVIIANQLREANDRIQHEVKQIARIQRALLPQTLPKFPGIALATSYETFDTAGGDLYDFSVLEAVDGMPRRLEVLIADASGHGPAASVVTAMLNAILYAYPNRTDGPGKVLSYANQHLHAKRLEGTFVTAFLAHFDHESRKLVYARAGHPPPVIKSPGAGAPVRRLDDVGGIPLGIADGIQYENGSVTLAPDESLVMFTDGVTEALDPGGVMFGVAGIERALEDCSGEAPCTIDHITAALRIHEAGRKPGDDQTVVAIQFTEPGKPSEGFGLDLAHTTRE
jgi:sigma-B regulation protein RsbU (phosphoserine phosphatase)